MENENTIIKTNLDELKEVNLDFYNFLKETFYGYRHEISTNRIKTLLDPVFIVVFNQKQDGFIDFVENDFLNIHLDRMFKAKNNIENIYVIKYQNLASRFLN